MKCILHLTCALMILILVIACESGQSEYHPRDPQLSSEAQAVFKPYQEQITGTQVKFKMLPIPGGIYEMGSPATEKARKADEGPQVKVQIEPFWMMETEVTWDMYKEYMKMYYSIWEYKRKLNTRKKDYLKNSEDPASTHDMVTLPTPLYEPAFHFELGDESKMPAVTMTPYAAKQFSKWLSKITGHFYRLPTEAEWEYACRAGTKTAYSWGDNPKQAREYAWYFDNSEIEDGIGAYRVVKSKKPNPWGLYDMHGNVSEIVFDQYDQYHYSKFKAEHIYHWVKTIRLATNYRNVSIRGGNWDSDVQALRSAARWKTNDNEWKISDPDLPQSPHWYTEEEGRMVGFRLVRPLTEPSEKVKAQFWNEMDEALIRDVQIRIEEGRGIQSTFSKDTIERINKLKQN